LLADFGGNMHAYLEEAKRKLLESGRAIAEPAKREIFPTQSLKLGETSMPKPASAQS
jgi:hypothetical protein